MSAFKVAAVQAAPAFLDLQRGIARTIELIEQARAQDVRLLAFPECWLPGYPWWIWLDSTAANLGYIVPYAANALVNGSAELDRIRAAARRAGMYVSLGAAERDHGSLYIAQFLLGPDGELLQARRKLKPTHMERTVFG